MFFNKLTRTGKVVFILLTIIAMVIIGLLVYRLTSPSSVITINTDPSAGIFVAQEKNGTFKNIGTGTATYTTKEMGDIYFMSSLGNKKTHYGANLGKGENLTVNMPLEETVAAEILFNGSLSHGHIAGTLVEGIEPASKSILSFRLGEDIPSRPQFIGIPFLKRIAWQDENNFAYSSFGEGVGLFLASRDYGSSRLATVVTTREGVTGANSNPIFKDVAKSSGQPLVLLANDGIYISNDMGLSAEKIAHVAEAEQQTLFADETFIYLGQDSTPSQYADETPTGREDDDHGHASTLRQYDYQGNKIGEFTVHESFLAAQTIGTSTIALNSSGLVVAANNVVREFPLHNELPRDLTVFNGTAYVLADGGLWRVLPETGVLQLVFDFSEYGVGLANSFINTADSLIFGSTPRSSGSSATKSQTFKIPSANLME